MLRLWARCLRRLTLSRSTLEILAPFQAASQGPLPRRVGSSTATSTETTTNATGRRPRSTFGASADPTGWSREGQKENVDEASLHDRSARHSLGRARLHGSRERHNRGHALNVRASARVRAEDRKSTRLNSSHITISY